MKTVSTGVSQRFQPGKTDIIIFLKHKPKQTLMIYMDIYKRELQISCQQYITSLATKIT